MPANPPNPSKSRSEIQRNSEPLETRPSARKAVFGASGALSEIYLSRWESAQSAYFTRPSERGTPWGANLYARYAFSPDRLFSAQLVLEGDYLRARSSVPGRARATYTRKGLRFGANCLFPSFVSFRPSAGFGGGLASEGVEIVVNGRKIASADSDLDISPYANLALEYSVSNAIGIEVGFVEIVTSVRFFRLGAHYAL